MARVDGPTPRRRPPGVCGVAGTTPYTGWVTLMRSRVEIRDSDGLTLAAIEMRRDKHDETKWHLAQTLAVGPHEKAHVIIDDKLVEILDDRSPPSNLFFRTPPTSGRN